MSQLAKMTEESKKRSKKKPWFKRGDRVIWATEHTETWHGTVKEAFKKVGSNLYTLVWVNWDHDPGDRELIKMDWLEPEPPLETLARIHPYKVGDKVKNIREIKVRSGDNLLVAPAGTVGVIGSLKRRKNRQPALEVHFDFLPEGKCLILLRCEVAPAE